MSEDGAVAAQRWQDALAAAALAMIDPAGCGGVLVRARAGAVRDTFMAHLKALVPPDRPFLRVPAGIADDRLIGGLDLARTLAEGRPILERGVMMRADGGVLAIAGAERLSPGAAARIAAAIDRSSVTVERDGLCSTAPTTFGLVLIDESVADDERPPAALADRVAFWIDLEGIPLQTAHCAVIEPGLAEAARRSFPLIGIDAALADVVCRAADALGVTSPRAPYFTLKAASASAALSGRDSIAEEDLALAVRLVLAPRATRYPATSDELAEPPPPPPTPDDQQVDTEQEHATNEVPLDVLLSAVAAALPRGLLESMAKGQRVPAAAPGKSGGVANTARRGRRLGSRPGSPGGSARLDLVATLRAAAPFQPLRRKDALRRGRDGKRPVLIERQDFRVARHEQRSETLTIFAVDASGSAALNRLAEAKGAVELLLAECYARRDWVALIAFRGNDSSLLLPPTRSLTRAKRCLNELPGGGGTPLASGLKSSLALASAASRQGRMATTVVLTDGRANVGLDGKPGRPAAEADALAVARAFAAAGERCILIDTSPRPQDFLRRLSSAIRGRYLPLPHADARSVSAAVREAAAT